MTMPERFEQSARAIERGYLRELQSLRVQEIAQEAIEKTHELLVTVSKLGIEPKETNK